MKKILSLLMMMALLCVTAQAEQVTLYYTGTTTTNMTGGNDAALVNLDENTWSVVGAKGGSDNFPGLNKDGGIRLYYDADGGNTITVSLLNGSTINFIHVGYQDNLHDNAYVKVDGQTVTPSNSVYQINSTSFVIGNAYTANEQVRITSITIDYDPEIAAVATPVITLDPADGPYYEGPRGHRADQGG